ncbi:MAG: hypothetical protein HRU15_04290, partial [Planctomycetes bacterium]|nr:hypothetical protein [Planctomycetota bacterium]
LSVYSSNSEDSHVQTSDNTGLGENEVLQSVVVPAAGNYYVKVSSSAGTGVQLYDISFHYGKAVYSLGVPSISVSIDPTTVGLSNADLAFKSFDASTQAYATATNLDTLKGYFAETAFAFSPNFTGHTEASTASFPLQQGWNLLSIPSENGASWSTSQIQVEKGGSTVNLATAADTNAWVYDYAWIFNESLKEYQPVYDNLVLSNGVNTIQGGESFWFYARTTGTTLIFPASVLPVVVGYSP